MTWGNLSGSALGLCLAQTARNLDGIMLVVLNEPRKLQIVEDELRYFLSHVPDLPVYQFPGWECLPYDRFSPHESITSERLKILSQLPWMKRGLILVQTANLIQRLPPAEFVHGHSFSLGVSGKLNIHAFREKLTEAHYSLVNQVISPGEFAIRGGLIDIFPMGSDRPLRIDLFDEDIDSIRTFDPDNQRSCERIDSIEILPAREFPMNKAGVRAFRSAFRKRFSGDPKTQAIYNSVSKGNTLAGTEFFFPLFFEHTETLFEYLPSRTRIVADENYKASVATAWAEIQDRFEICRRDPEYKILNPDELYLSAEQVYERLHDWPMVKISNTRNHADWNAPCSYVGQYTINPRSERPLDTLVSHIRSSSHRILISVETPGRQDNLEGILRANSMRPARLSHFDDFLYDTSCPLGLVTAPLERGFTVPDAGVEIICEGQLYGERVMQRRRRQNTARDPAAIIRSLAELSPGDPVVHIEHGVGRYHGLKQLEILGRVSEYLILEYQQGDRLYIPVTSLNLINRFTGGSPESAPLHKLGGEQWEKSKNHAREKAYDVATELLELEAVRKARKGFGFAVNAEEYEKFISQFPFEETPDQVQVINEVIEDLKSDTPMDRLVCGDVGFGKTEIALRAAFVVTQNFRQVAILCPTTLLAQQHLQSFIDRFSEWPINIASLSRFNTPKQNERILAQVTEGKLDIVVGTHRMLQSDVRFPNLGLIIIDEEHRFGVTQKEQLKKLRSQSDILTLTATPIPRTLNLTMSGLRAISIIATPPVNRLSIKTFVRSWNPELIREACLREIRRGGQIFFLHNEVRSIESILDKLGKIIPEGDIRIAHGQMPEMKLEGVMQDFYHHRFNILLCTSIVESGIDIPRANTIIINRADRFGLAQLHQLRGRVGRSHHQAFAYLFVPDIKILTGNAKKRLEAIESMDDLGIGFSLASQDLEIRGAGELLGETQSGLIDDVGFSLYSEYLNMAIRSIQTGQLPFPSADTVSIQDRQCTVDLHTTAWFPEDYIPNPHSRLVLYKRIAGAITDEDLSDIRMETIDRFGPMPQQGKNLFQVTGIRLLAEKLDIRKVDIDEQGGHIHFHDNPVIDFTELVRFVQDSPHVCKPVGPDRLHFIPAIESGEKRILEVRRILELLDRYSANGTHSPM